MKVFLKVLFLTSGIILLWERRRVLYVWPRTGGSRLWSTWWGLWRISAKSLESAASQSSIIVGWVGDSKPCFFIFVSRAWRRCLQPSPSIPHQAGLAYTILDTIVALVTSHRWVPLSPWAISILTAINSGCFEWRFCQREHGKLNLPRTTPPEFSSCSHVQSRGLECILTSHFSTDFKTRIKLQLYIPFVVGQRDRSIQLNFCQNLWNSLTVPVDSVHFVFDLDHFQPDKSIRINTDGFHKGNTVWTVV